jgi:uncharacterized glyoxalase superfamily protein PhnB
MSSHCSLPTDGAGLQLEPHALETTDNGIYAATDPEGHQWTFAQRVRDVPPEELHPPA